MSLCWLFKRVCFKHKLVRIYLNYFALDNAMKNFLVPLLLTFFLSAKPLQAQEFSQIVTLTGMHPIGSNRPLNVNTQNLTRIYFNPVNWGGGDCGTGAADISNDDTHLLAVLMQAISKNYPVRVYVDSRLKPLDNNCRVVALHVNFSSR